jgi:hypothetical protein
MRKKGAALLSVVIITSVIFVVAVTILDRSIRTYRDILDIIKDKEGYYLAESLVYDALGYSIERDSTATTSDDIPSDPTGESPRDLKRENRILNSYSLDPSQFQINKLLIAKVAEESKDSIRRNKYNINCQVQLEATVYVTNMQVETVFVGGRYSLHIVLDRKSYKYKP